MNPRFDLFARRPFLIYPYTARTNLTDRRAPKSWRTLVLENEYLRLSVLPDLGGRIYSCVDKSNGAELFYANGAIKYADVAYRGAWVALGVEFNFPVSHNWMTVSPVDFATRPAPRRQRLDLGRQHRPALRDDLARGADAAARALAARAERRRSTTAATCGTASTGGRPPPSARRRLADPLPDAVHGGSPFRGRRYLAGGQQRARTSASRATTARDSCPRFATGAASRSWVSIGPRPSRASCTWPITRTCRARRSGRGAGTTTAATGAARSRTTTAPTSRSRRASSATRRPTRSSSRGRCSASASTYQPVRKIGGWSRANEEGDVHLRRDAAGALRVGLNLTRSVRGGRVVVRDGARSAARGAARRSRLPGPSTRSFPDLAAAEPYTVEIRDAQGACCSPTPRTASTSCRSPR